MASRLDAGTANSVSLRSAVCAVATERPRNVEIVTRSATVASFLFATPILVSIPGWGLFGALIERDVVGANAGADGSRSAWRGPRQEVDDAQCINLSPLHQIINIDEFSATASYVLLPVAWA